MKYIILFFVICLSLKAEDVHIYSDEGAWEEGIIALENFYNHYDISNKRVYADDINSVGIDEGCKIICFPGGYAYNYKKSLTGSAIKSIRNFVNSGGAYLGICAGAYFASSEVVWEGKSYIYRLGLFQGKAFGAIDSIADWDNYCMTSINNINIPGQDGDNISNSVLYYGGPYFIADSSFVFDTVSIWDDYNNLPAIIKFAHGNGRVLLIGPHLEIEENDNRDGTDFAGELDDIESDWDLLYNMVSWLIGNANDISGELHNEVKSFNIYPNPASDYFFIETKNKTEIITITDIYGNTTVKIIVSVHPGSLRIDIRDFQSGIYFIHTSVKTGILIVNK